MGKGLKKSDMENIKKPILIYGSREFSACVHALALECGYQCAGFIDDFNSDHKFIIGNFEKIKEIYPPITHQIVLAIGYNNLQLRQSIYQKVKKAGYELPVLTHPSVMQHDSVVIQEGAIVMRGSIVDINSTIGSIAVLWPGVIVNHDCKIGANTFLSPGVTVCGFCEVGRDSFIGAGAILTDHIKVPYNTFIRAGEVVHKNTTYKSFTV